MATDDDDADGRRSGNYCGYERGRTLAVYEDILRFVSGLYGCFQKLQDFAIRPKNRHRKAREQITAAAKILRERPKEDPAVSIDRCFTRFKAVMEGENPESVKLSKKAAIFIKYHAPDCSNNKPIRLQGFYC